MVKNMELCGGWEVTIEVKGNVQEYAMAFLHIFNNVRESSELVRVTNRAESNDISVVCYDGQKTLDATKRYLKQFGEIKSVSLALIVRCGEDIEYDYEKYDTIACDFQEF